MDSSSFDRLSVALSRRGVVRTIAAALAGGLALAANEASATSSQRICRTLQISCTRNTQCCSGYCERRTSVPRRQRFRCGCGIDQALCDGVCTQLGTEENCSTCGDACTGYDTCISGACTDACTILTCAVDEECYQGACRKMCVSGTCATDEICVTGVELCLTSPCLADPNKDLFGLCLTFDDGSIVDNVIGGEGSACTSYADCETQFAGNTWQDAFVQDGFIYGFDCVAAAAYWNGEQRVNDPDRASTCISYVYLP